MDNASYHSRVTDAAKSPTSSWNKPEIVEYMIANKIVPPQLLPNFKSPDQVQQLADNSAANPTTAPFVYIEPRYQGGALPTVAQYNTLTKATLLMYIPKKPKEYVTDEMCRAAGIEMVRLPPYHCEFNPIELVWARAKGAVASRNVEYKLDHAMKYMREECCKCDAAYWRKLDDHARKEEQLAIEGDTLIQSVIDRIGEDGASHIIVVDDSDDESEWEDVDDEDVEDDE